MSQYGSNIVLPDGSSPVSSTALNNVESRLGRQIAAVEATASRGLVAMGTFFKRQDGKYPLPGTGTAPLASDGGIVSGQPATTTGMRFVRWDDLTAFNYQGMNMQPGPSYIAGLGVGMVPGYNHDTPRKFGYGNLGNDYIGGTIDFSFDTDALKVYPVWHYFQDYNNPTGSQAKNDMHMLVSNGDEMQHLSDGSGLNGLPAKQSSGTGIKHRPLVFNERRTRTIRAIMPGYAYLMGVWIDQYADMRKSPNKPLVFMHNGDSWNEPYGAAWDYNNWGNGFPTGSYQCIGLPQAASFYTGMVHGTVAQGGTGEFNANGTSHTATDYAGTDSSAMWSDSRVDDFIANFASQYPVLTDIGGWNDGDLPGSTSTARANYAARVAARYDKVFTRTSALGAGREVKALNFGIQPVDLVAGSVRDQSTLGQADACALARFSGKVLGHIPLKDMWRDGSTSGSRSLYTNSQGGLWIHQNISGHYSTAAWMFGRAAGLAIPADYARKAMAA